jgi:hypothetical protein
MLIEVHNENLPAMLKWFRVLWSREDRFSDLFGPATDVSIGFPHRSIAIIDN